VFFVFECDRRVQRNFINCLFTIVVVRMNSNLQNRTALLKKNITDKERMMVFEGSVFCFIIPYKLIISVLS